METSREDVGIAIRSAFLRTDTKQRFSLFFLVLFSIILIFVEKIDYDNEEIKEQMFKAKLTAFELPFVKDSDKRDLKAKLRKAETFKDIISIVAQF